MAEYVTTARDEVRIGSTIWVWDDNKRVYRKDGTGGPIWREHWRACTVVGETRVSWVLDWFERKVPKRGDLKNVWIAFSEAEIDELAWVQSHRYKLMRVIERCKDPATLKQIAALVGYTPGAGQ